MKKMLILGVLLAMVLGFSLQAHATLQNLGTDSLGNRLIYDTDLNITWYDYSNSANTWYDQRDWALGLTVNFGSNVYDDWRLPITDESCSGFGCTSSEMGHLYHTELGNAVFGPMSSTGDFQNLQSTTLYWSGTSYSANTIYAWYLHFNNGGQQFFNKDPEVASHALAVMDGLAVAPEPISSILFVTGGATLGLRRFRKKFKK